jgi:hypothetical protein
LHISEEQKPPKKKQFEELTPEEQEEYLEWIRKETWKEQQFIDSVYGKIYGLTLDGGDDNSKNEVCISIL